MKDLTEEEMAFAQAASWHPGHNHMTRDIKRKGVCPGCDVDHAGHQFEEYDSEGNYQS